MSAPRTKSAGGQNAWKETPVGLELLKLEGNFYRKLLTCKYVHMNLTPFHVEKEGTLGILVVLSSQIPVAELPTFVVLYENTNCSLLQRKFA